MSVITYFQFSLVNVLLPEDIDLGHYSKINDLFAVLKKGKKPSKSFLEALKNYFLNCLLELYQNKMVLDVTFRGKFPHKNLKALLKLNTLKFLSSSKAQFRSFDKFLMNFEPF